MITRICAGLPVAVASLDEDAERTMRDRVDAVHAATGLLADADSRARWLAALARLSGPPLIGGRATRLLLDAGEITLEEAAERMTRELSAGAPAVSAAGWAEGFLSGSGLLLVHDQRLLRLTDGWLASLDADKFQAVLQALRRTSARSHRPSSGARSVSRRLGWIAMAANRPPRPTRTLTGSAPRRRSGPWPGSWGCQYWRAQRERHRRAQAPLAARPWRRR